MFAEPTILPVVVETVVSSSGRLERMSYADKLSLATTRRTTALVCLIALLLTHAQVASATLMAMTGACCTGDQCPIHGNHHPVREIPAQRNDDSAKDCDHHDHGANKMRSCSMSCCHTVEQPAVHAHLFVLTPIFVTAALAPRSIATLALAALRLSLAFAPPAPPPKSSTN
jgi:hypothetical protein